MAANGSRALTSSTVALNVKVPLAVNILLVSFSMIIFLEKLSVLIIRRAYVIRFSEVNVAFKCLIAYSNVFMSRE